MTNSVQSLDNLVNFYENLKIQCTKATLAGKSLPAMSTEFMLDLERGAADLDLIKRADFYKIRRKVLIGTVYDALCRVSAVNSDMITQVAESVIDPMLDNTFSWLAAHKGLQNTTRDEFVDGINNKLKDENLHLHFYFRPLTLLTLLSDRPEIADEIGESSTYFPHRLFLEKRQSIKDIDRDIAEVLVTLVPEDLRARIARITDYATFRNTGSSEGTFGGSLLGKYRLPSHIAWVTRDPNAETELDELYGGIEGKRQIYGLLGDFLQIQRENVIEHGKSIRQWNKSSAFGMNATHFTVMMQALKAYATNQILHVWRDHPSDSIPYFKLARQVGLTPTATRDELQIRDSHGGSVVIYRPPGPMLNSTSYLPFLVAVMNKHVQTASSLSAKGQTQE